MENKILEEKENKILGRSEVKLILEASKNPSFDESTSAVAEMTKSNKENILIKQIKGKFGSSEFLISAEIYKNKEDRDKQAVRLEKKKKEAGK